MADARKCLDIDKLTVAEKNDYVRHMENLRYQRSVIKTGYDDGWQKGLAVLVLGMLLAVVTMLALRKFKKSKKKQPFALIPFLSVAAMAVFII